MSTQRNCAVFGLIVVAGDAAERLRARPAPGAPRRRRPGSRRDRSPGRHPKPPPTATGCSGRRLICVIVPPVENPFFGAMQEIAATKAEELGYTTLKLSTTTTPTSRWS